MIQEVQMGFEYGKELTKNQNTNKKEEKSEVNPNDELATATLELSGKKVDDDVQKIYYKPDLDKIRQMKAENQQRLLEKMLGTAKDSFIKQLGGLKNVLGKALAGEKIEGLEIDIKAEDIEQAKKDVAEGGYWSAENTATRLVDFAKALSGGNPEQAEKMANAIKDGFKQAEELWGDKLPQISQDTLRLTMEKIDQWVNEK